MMGAVQMVRYPAPPVDRDEVLRYAGAKAADDTLRRMLDECISVAWDGFSYRVSYTVYPITHTDKGISFGFFTTASRDLAKNLDGCHAVILFGASVGRTIDRIVMRESVVSPARALLFDALGTERVEALADAFCRDLAEKYGKEGYALRPRFSPGYGDLPLSTQTQIFSVLNLPKSLNVTLNDSLLMSPKKSVTAFVGITQKEKK